MISDNDKPSSGRFFRLLKELHIQQQCIIIALIGVMLIGLISVNNRERIEEDW